VADPAQRDLLATPTGHLVKFYDRDAALVEAIAEFVAHGVAVGEPALVVATADHRAALVGALASRGIEATPERGVEMLDAAATLARIAPGDQPSRVRFEDVVGGAVARLLATRGAKRVRAYGEMVDLLWRRGQRGPALELEALWNELAARSPLVLLCAYAMAGFAADTDLVAFRDVCGVHTHVLPADGVGSSGGDAETRRRSTAELQQRACSLEQELAARGETELALRGALAREIALREAAEREVGVANGFAAMLGHDLRNPLNTIAMAATLLTRGASNTGGAGESVTRAAARISLSADRMARMIDQLLDLARIRAAGGLSLARTRVDAAEVCRRVTDELELGARAPIAVSTSGHTFGMWDRDRLLQVFSNLVANALVHGGGGLVAVDIDGVQGGRVVVSVRNSGAIDPEVMPVLFDTFRSGTTPRTGSRGLGLGLYITRQIVHAHGGEIAVQSDTSKGTVVSVDLPRLPSHEVDAEPLQLVV
jgi:signal transduction histidine kinase